MNAENRKVEWNGPFQYTNTLTHTGEKKKMCYTTEQPSQRN